MLNFWKPKTNQWKWEFDHISIPLVRRIYPQLMALIGLVSFIN